jgi:REP element-mobilizing transposase RayT
MSTAMPVIAGQSWELTRRCTRRQFLLTPDHELTQALLYCFAACAERWNIKIHAIALMLNHYHSNITDLDGNRVEFTRDLHQMMARCVKAFHAKHGLDVDDAVWDASEQTGRLMLDSSEGRIASIVYCLANPISAGLVRRSHEWPSFLSRPRDMLGRSISLKRPACLGGTLPQVMALEFCVPPQHVATACAFVHDVETHLKGRIRQKRLEMETAGRSFGRREQVLAMKPTDTPKTAKKVSFTQPAFRAVTREAVRQARERLRDWRKAYREAYERFRDGDHDVVWPPGTWKASRYYGAKVAPDSDWFAPRFA